MSGIYSAANGHYHSPHSSRLASGSPGKAIPHFRVRYLGVTRQTKLGLTILLGLGIALAVGVAGRLMRATQAAAVPFALGNEKLGTCPWAGAAGTRQPQTESQALSWMAAKPALLSPAGPPGTAPKPALDDAGWWPAIGKKGPAPSVPGAAARPEKGDKANLPHSGPPGAWHKLDLSPFSSCPLFPPEGPAPLLAGPGGSAAPKDASGADDLAARQQNVTHPR
jgi:hypothetical protein